MIYLKIDSSEIRDARGALNDNDIYFEELNLSSMVDEMKSDLFMENIEKFTLEQLEAFIKLHSK